VEEYPVAVDVVLDLILEDDVLWLFREGESSCSGGEVTGLYSTDDMDQNVSDRYERRRGPSGTRGGLAASVGCTCPSAS